jgi:nicotinamidase-related amidase
MNSQNLKVLIVVDVQNCFIQGGSLGDKGRDSIPELFKFIKLVENISDKIQNDRYDLVVFSKDYHPINHSSLYETTDGAHGLYTYHCRNLDKDCNNKKLLYMSIKCENFIRSKIKEALFKGINISDEDYANFFNYQMRDTADFNFYNRDYQEMYKAILENPKIKSEIEKIISEDNKKYLEEQSQSKKTIGNLINEISEDLASDIKNMKNYKSIDGLKYTKNLFDDDDSMQTIYDYFRDNTNEDFFQIFKRLYILNFLKKIKNKELRLSGFNLNYLFYGTNIHEIIKELNTKNHEIRIKTDKISDTPRFDEKILNIDPILANNTKFITILKGEYCNYEAYSAFNYHAEIKKKERDGSLIKSLFNIYDKNLNELPYLPAEEKLSSGLFEYILKNCTKNTKNIDIDVCGLVTNICVINTVHQGLAMWNNVYKKYEKYNGLNCNFNLLEYLSVPLNLAIPVPHLNYPYGEQINALNNMKQLSHLVYLYKEKFTIDVAEPNKHNLKGQKINEYKFNLYIGDNKIEVLPFKKDFQKFAGGNKKKAMRTSRKK